MSYPGAQIRRNPAAHEFLFATGIENSYPTITGEDGQTERVDELAKTGHYKHWKEDFQLVLDLGVKYLRYGPPYYKVHLGPGRYDWSFVDETFNELHRLGITPIADLCHFGMPEWAGNFQNSDWPPLFAEYAAAFAQRYPWVQMFTPVNEIFILCRFSAELGFWNERQKSDGAFVKALRNSVRATILAEEAIVRVRPEALFVQSEASSYFHPTEPKALGRAGFLNQKRFLALDLCYGMEVPGGMYHYLIDNGMPREDYEWFLEHGAAVRPYCIMGNDYYASNEYMVPVGEGPVTSAGDIFGYYVITRQYFEHFQLPVMHTETNHRGAGNDAQGWLHKQWANLVALKLESVPIIGFTWFSLLDQVDWDSGLRENKGTVDPLGLYDLARHIRPVGQAYRELIAKWRPILPMEKFAVNLWDEPRRPGGRGS